MNLKEEKSHTNGETVLLAGTIPMWVLLVAGEICSRPGQTARSTMYSPTDHSVSCIKNGGEKRW